MSVLQRAHYPPSVVEWSPFAQHPLSWLCLRLARFLTSSRFCHELGSSTDEMGRKAFRVRVGKLASRHSSSRSSEDPMRGSSWAFVTEGRLPMVIAAGQKILRFMK